MAGVVVGVHGPGSSAAPVRWASDEAALRGIRLTLVHAWDEPLELTVQLEPGDLPELAGAARSCAVHGRAAAALLAQQPELLVLGRHRGAGHVSRLTRSCVHHAACPVVIVPDHPRASSDQLVVGVCGTRASDSALSWARDEAVRRDLRLVVVHVWQVHPSSARDLLRPSRAVPAQRSRADRHLRDWVTSVLGSAQAELRAVHGAPLDELLAVTAHSDLLVLGRSVHRGMGRLLQGSVGDDLTALAACPVAVVPTEPSRDTARA